VTDVDLVQSQLRIAAGETLADLRLSQESIQLRGAALQADSSAAPGWPMLTSVGMRARCCATARPNRPFQELQRAPVRILTSSSWTGTDDRARRLDG
jgi:biotin carboxylase